MKFTQSYRCFEFKRPSGTSRGILTEKHAWFIKIYDGKTTGLGECSIIPGLSPDFGNLESYSSKLEHLLTYCKTLDWTNYSTLEELKKNSDIYFKLKNEPSILFGLETALLDFWNGGKKVFFKNAFSEGKLSIPINGLIWMGDLQFIRDQISELKHKNFNCIKMKIGASDFETEIKLLEEIRSNFPPETILRVDANGAFNSSDALEKLGRLKALNIHSIEQPVKQNNWQLMRDLILSDTVAVALDEELIGVNELKDKINLLDTLMPQYIILKPSLHGGILGCAEWIELAQEKEIDFWMTSALESNIGLNCIAQFTAEYKINKHHGLGTGSLYVENIESRLRVENGQLSLT